MKIRARMAIILFQMLLIITIPLLVRSCCMVTELTRVAEYMKEAKPYVSDEMSEEIEHMSLADAERVYTEAIVQEPGGINWKLKSAISIPASAIFLRKLEYDPVLTVEIGCWMFLLFIDFLVVLWEMYCVIKKLRPFISAPRKGGKINKDDYHAYMAPAPFEWRGVAYIVVIGSVMATPWGQSHGFWSAIILFALLSALDAKRFVEWNRKQKFPPLSKPEELIPITCPPLFKAIGRKILHGRKSNQNGSSRRRRVAQGDTQSHATPPAQPAQPSQPTQPATPPAQPSQSSQTTSQTGQQTSQPRRRPQPEGQRRRL